MESTLEADVRAYLQALADHLGYADACEALGLARGSHKTLKRIYADYGVVPPTRVNQYGTPSVSASEDDTDEFMGQVVWIPLNRAERRKTGFEKAVVLTDIHIPYHDPDAIRVALAIIEDIQPDCVILGGDLIDLFSISKYERDPKRKLMLSDEIKCAREFLYELRRIAGTECRIVFVQGNHEMRLEVYLQDKAPELSGLEEVALESLLHLNQLDIEYVRGKRMTKTAYVKYGNVLVGHFDTLGAKAGDTAKKLLLKWRAPVVQGHCHRLALVPYTHPDGTVLWGCEAGCLASLDPEYMDCPDWQHGLVVLSREVETDRTHIQLVPIEGYEAIYNDVVYRAA